MGDTPGAEGVYEQILWLSEQIHNHWDEPGEDVDRGLGAGAVKDLDVLTKTRGWGEAEAISVALRMARNMSDLALYGCSVLMVSSDGSARKLIPDDTSAQ